MTKEEQWIIKAVLLLKQVEFSATEDNWREITYGYHVCPICGLRDDHEGSCELNELLREAEGIL